MVITYDVTNQKTFDGTRRWTDSLAEHARESVARILVANKVDLVKERVVTTKQGQDLAR